MLVLLGLLAALLQLIGSVLVAHSLLHRLAFWHWPLALLGALIRSRRASAAAKIAETFGGEEKLISLQGLAFIILGFLLQLLVTGIEAWLAFAR